MEGVYQREQGSWYARYRVNGKLVRKSFGCDRAAAIRHVEKARTLRRSGEGSLPITAKSPLQTNLDEGRIGETLMGELCDDALQFSKRHHRDLLNPPIRIEAIRRTFGHRAAHSIRPSEVEAWLASLKVSAATEARYKSTLSLCFREGMRNDKVQLNPARLVRNRPIRSGVLRYLLPNEEQRLRQVITARFRHHLPELDVAINTGLRKSEQYNLRWSDVDFAGRKILVHASKSDIPRTVYMNGHCFKAVQVLKKTSTGQHVFPISENRTWWKIALQDAKVRNFRWHDLRHTFCSRLAQAGVNLKVIQEAAGHKTIAMTSRYAHLDHSAMRSALESLG